MKAWLEHNLHSLGQAWRTLAGQPFASLFSILVMGIALALPTGLYVGLANLDRLAGGVPTQPELTLYLKPGTDPGQGRRLAQDLAGRRDVARARFVAKEEGLLHLQEAGLAELIAGLDANPLPDAILVTAAGTAPADLERLATDLGKRPEADRLIADTDWARRLAALLAFGHELVLLLAVLLGLALAAITGNTIRLQIYAAREEIEVSRLIGATDRFIRRPFLYFGALQGLLGGLAGWAIVSAGLWQLQGGLTRLAGAWGGQFSLAGLGPIEIAILLSSASLLGFLGAFLAVGHTLARLD